MSNPFEKDSWGHGIWNDAQAELKKEQEELAANYSGLVAKEIEQCASWTSEIQTRDELLRTFVKHMTAASKAWFPKEMIEAKEKAEELLNG